MLIRRRVNGVDNDGGTTATNSICPVISTDRIPCYERGDGGSIPSRGATLNIFMANRNDFSTLAYAKMLPEYDRDLFIKEYDERILPYGKSITNGLKGVEMTKELNKAWGMVPEEEYDKGDIWTQIGDAVAMRYIKRERPCWHLTQLMELDFSKTPDPFLSKFAEVGGTSFRNETLDPKFEFKIRERYKDLKIWQWINDVLPFKKINGVHCVSLPAGGFAAIHRDQKGLYDANSSAGHNKLYAMGFVVVVINVSSGGAPLYWALDGAQAKQAILTDDPLYISNDYFLHGVPICTERRRQVRVIGIPKPEMWDLLDHNNMIDVGPNYEFKPGFVYE